MASPASKRDVLSPVAAGISPQPKGFEPMKTPQDIEGGALRAGGAINVWSREYIGSIVQYAAVGMIFGTLPGTVYPFLFNYLNMEAPRWCRPPCCSICPGHSSSSTASLRTVCRSWATVVVRS
ncbi:hypothetical protein PI125_g10991 [Phytophthora idaei]|nr:hypothetical protein PI125_g10991 [Phytophthora idaei]